MIEHGEGAGRVERIDHRHACIGASSEPLGQARLEVHRVDLEGNGQILPPLDRQDPLNVLA